MVEPEVMVEPDGWVREPFGWSKPMTEAEIAEHRRLLAEAFADPRNTVVEYLDLGNGCIMRNCVFVAEPEEAS